MIESTYCKRSWIAFFALYFLVAVTTNAFAERPPFDKSSHKNTAWIHCNSWFTPDKPRQICDLGGPDVAFKLYPQGRVWIETAKELEKFGINGIQMEVGIWNPTRPVIMKGVLDEFAASGTNVEAEFFIPIHMPQFHANMVQFLENTREDWEHPRYHKIDGRPVIVLYRYWAQKPEAIQAMIEEAESKLGTRFIWLAEMMYADDDTVRKYLPVLDGITMYGNWTLTNQQEYFKRLVPIMHNEFPEKIFEAGVQNLYCDHFHMGGVVPRNLDKYFASWKTALEAQPDSICMTNLFDHSENSHLLPSWAWEDVMMRIAQYNLNEWRGLPPYKTPANIRPEIYVVNSANTIIGHKAYFDLISFPAGAQAVDGVEFSLVDVNGKVLKDFGKITIQTSIMDIKRFEVDTTEFADETVLYPKIRWQVMPKGTALVPGWRPWLLFYASCTENALKQQDMKNADVSAGSWMINGMGPGSVVPYPEDGKVCLTANVVPMFGGAYNHNNNNHCNILRNGREILSFPAQMLNFSYLLTVPNPMSAVDSYQIELENMLGYRYLSLPIYISNNNRPGKVDIPIPNENMEVVNYSIDACRVPFFFYPCNTDDVRLLRDVSGYSHDGFIAGESFQGGHLPQLGYRHEHQGYVSNKRAADPVFMRDEDGQGFYRFNGSGYIKIMGQGMPPYASTVEFSVRVDKYVPGGLFGSCNHQLNVELTEDGKIQATRRAEQEGMASATAAPGNDAKVTSQSPIPLNQWVKIAIVYDCQDVALYVNGELQGKAPFTPRAGQEWFNAAIIGGIGVFPYNQDKLFTGDITRIRIYARNLSPEEFL